LTECPVPQVAPQRALNGVGSLPRALPAPAQNLFEKQHVLPVEFKDYFRRNGININKYAVRLPIHVHNEIHAVAKGGAWNNAWAEYIARNPHATRAEIYRETGRLIHQFGIDGNPVQSYWK
jgi:hypothetical protein